MKLLDLTHVNRIEGMTEVPSLRLIAECITGNEDAIETLVREYETGIFRLAMSILGDSDEAHEVTQETFLSALRALASYQEKQSLKAWLYTIALNHSRSHLRKRKVIERLRATLATVFRVEAQKQVSPEETMVQSEKEAAIWTALKQLDERHRIVLVLRYFHEFSIAEISDMLSVKEGTIHSRLHNARERLRDALKQL